MDDQTKNQNQTKANGQAINVTPGISKEVERPQAGFISHSEKLPVLDKELQEARVEAVDDKPVLTEQHQQVGITHSAENNVPSLTPSDKIQLPLTEEEADQIIKNNKDKINTDVGEHGDERSYTALSILFYATLVKKLWKQLKKRKAFA